MQATIETARHAAAVTLVRPRELIFEDSSPNFCLRSAASFQIPAFEDQDCAAQGHRGIEQGVERVLQNERRARGRRGDGVKKMVWCFQQKGGFFFFCWGGGFKKKKRRKKKLAP